MTELYVYQCPHCRGLGVAENFTDAIVGINHDKDNCVFETMHARTTFSAGIIVKNGKVIRNELGWDDEKIKSATDKLLV